MRKNNQIPATAEQTYLAAGEPMKVFPAVPGNRFSRMERQEAGGPCAFEDGRMCRALIQKHCMFCRFFQTPAQLSKGRNRAQARLKRMGLQQKYQEKYKEHTF